MSWRDYFTTDDASTEQESYDWRGFDTFKDGSTRFIVEQRGDEYRVRPLPTEYRRLGEGKIGEASDD